jgi:hypothetical protein
MSQSLSEYCAMQSIQARGGAVAGGLAFKLEREQAIRVQ